MIRREQKYAHNQIGSFFQVGVNKNRCLKPQPSFSYIPISILLWCPIGTGFHLFHPIPSEKVLGPTFTPPEARPLGGPNNYNLKVFGGFWKTTNRKDGIGDRKILFKQFKGSVY